MDPLRIGIDGYNLALPAGTGVASYGRTLAETLAAAGHRVEGVFGIDAGAAPATRELLFFDRVCRAAPKRSWSARQALRLAALRPRITRGTDEVPLTGLVPPEAATERLPAFDRLVTSPRLFDLAHRHFAAHRRFVRLRMLDPPPIMHWTYPVPVVLEGARNLYTIHDVVPLRLPFATASDKAGYHALLAACVRQAAAICTVSEASRDDILRTLPIAPDRLHNSYQASSLPDDAAPADPAEDARVIEGMYRLPRDGYFLFFGAIEPKKNVARLIEAYLAADTPTPLVVVGSGGWQNAHERALLDGDRLTDRIVRLDHLPRGILLRLIRGARAVLFPSLYEGFGLPVLEAMQLGAPVLTATAGALPEVAGKAAVLVDPWSVDAIAAGIRRLDSDAALRRQLAAAGPERARFFSRARYRERLEAMYRTVLAQPG